jgi:hypothetical protein
MDDSTGRNVKGWKLWTTFSWMKAVLQKRKLASRFVVLRMAKTIHLRDETRNGSSI